MSTTTNKPLKFLILRGLPASGKSTFAAKFVKENPDFVEVNRDNIRIDICKGRGDIWAVKESKVTARETEAIKKAFEAGKSVISSNMNLESRIIKRFKKMADEYNAVVEINESFLSVPIEELLERDRNRERSVGEERIRQLHLEHLGRKSYLKPQDTALPKAVIFDVDGTLTTGPLNREPFDMEKILHDEPNPYTINFLEMFCNMPDVKVFIFSGREECGRDDTISWLSSYSQLSVPTIYEKITMHMRPDGDGVGDDELKLNLFNEHVKGKYHVVAVFDDRLRVCRVWRDLGLPLFRVGDFDSVF